MYFSSDVSSSSISCLHQTDEFDLASIRKCIFSRVWTDVSFILFLFFFEICMLLLCLCQFV